MKPVRQSREVTPVGRVDVLIRRIAQRATEQFVNPHIRFDVWPELEPVVEAWIKERKIPQRPMSLMELARKVGVLKRGAR